MRARLNMNSGNSSKPPSSDVYSNPSTPKSSRKPSGRKPGGQPGHTGSRLEMSEHVDLVEEFEPDQCAHCGGALEDEPVDVEARQVIDIPEKPQPQITEFRVRQKRCSCCGEVSTCDFPEGVSQKVQYGSRLKALVLYLSCYQMIAQRRIKQAIESMYGLEISEGFINYTLEQASKALGGYKEKIKSLIMQSPVVGCDETGMQVNGKRMWLHTTNTPDISYQVLHEKRGTAAIEDIGVLPQYHGYAIHDRWASYFQYNQCNHALCNAHLLRDLKYIHEELGYNWAEDMIQLLLEAKRISERKRGPTARQVNEISHRYTRIIAWGLRVCTREGGHVRKNQRGPSKQSKPKNLLDDMKKHKEAILAFLTNPDIPFDNNASERDIRMSKVKTKVSGCFRSVAGGQAFAAIRSHINTAIKNNINVLQALEGVVINTVLFPK